MGEIKAIAFDLDGTLLDSAGDIAQSVKETLTALGIAPLSDEIIRSYIGDGTPTLLARALSNTRAAIPGDHALQADAETLFKKYYTQNLTSKTYLYPKVYDTLRALQASRYHLACITNKPEVFTLPVLKHFGLDTIFTVVTGGDTLAHKKPHPMPLQYAAEQFAITTAELLMVGDSVNDVLAARNAGSPVLVVEYGYTDDPYALGSDKVIADFSDILPWISRQEA